MRSQNIFYETNELLTNATLKGGGVIGIFIATLSKKNNYIFFLFLSECTFSQNFVCLRIITRKYFRLTCSMLSSSGKMAAKIVENVTKRTKRVRRASILISKYAESIFVGFRKYFRDWKQCKADLSVWIRLK